MCVGGHRIRFQSANQLGSGLSSYFAFHPSSAHRRSRSPNSFSLRRSSTCAVDQKSPAAAFSMVRVISHVPVVCWVHELKIWFSSKGL